MQLRTPWIAGILSAEGVQHDGYNFIADHEPAGNSHTSWKRGRNRDWSCWINNPEAPVQLKMTLEV